MIRFIHIPKNAGTTVGKMLGRNGIEFVVGKDGYRHGAAHAFDQSLPSFAVVRNPYTRTVSWYEWMCRNPKYARISFDDFVLGRFSSGRGRHAWTPQKHWTHSQDGATQLVTHILRYENLQEDLVGLFPAISGKWLHLNSGGIVDYDAYYTDQTRRAVTESFSEDFINFGYPTK